MVTSDGLVMETGCFHSQEQELSHALSSVPGQCEDTERLGHPGEGADVSGTGESLDYIPCSWFKKRLSSTQCLNPLTLQQLVSLYIVVSQRKMRRQTTEADVCFVSPAWDHLFPAGSFLSPSPLFKQMHRHSTCTSTDSWK